jgi:hypothetical protein
MEREVEAVRAGGGDIHRMAAFPQPLAEIGRCFRIILDE